MNPYCVKCQAKLNDGHDCDNCSYCGTDQAPEEIKEVEKERRLDGQKLG